MNTKENCSQVSNAMTSTSSASSTSSKGQGRPNRNQRRKVSKVKQAEDEAAAQAARQADLALTQEVIDQYTKNADADADALGKKKKSPPESSSLSLSGSSVGSPVAGSSSLSALRDRRKAIVSPKSRERLDRRNAWQNARRERIRSEKAAKEAVSTSFLDVRSFFRAPVLTS